MSFVVHNDHTQPTTVSSIMPMCSSLGTGFLDATLSWWQRWNQTSEFQSQCFPLSPPTQQEHPIRWWGRLGGPTRATDGDRDAEGLLQDEKW